MGPKGWEPKGWEPKAWGLGAWELGPWELGAWELGAWELGAWDLRAGSLRAGSLRTGSWGLGARGWGLGAKGWERRAGELRVRSSEASGFRLALDALTIPLRILELPSSGSDWSAPLRIRIKASSIWSSGDPSTRHQLKCKSMTCTCAFRFKI